MRALLVSLVLASVIVALASGSSIPLHRATHRMHKSMSEISPFLNKYRHPAGYATGSTIPMQGGLLTVGAYFANIVVGTPPTQHTVLIDTGSSNLALPGSDCVNCGKYHNYNISDSLSAEPIACDSVQCLTCSPPGFFSSTTECILGQQPFCYDDSVLSNPCGFAITYGGGSTGISGGYITDDVCMGPYCLKDFNFGVIERSDPPANMGSGIIGFAWDYNACNPSCPSLFFPDVAEAYSIPAVFGMCITPTKGGVLDLGYIDSSKFSGSLTYAPLTIEMWWNIDVQDITIGANSINLPSYFYAMTNDVIGSFVDSGTSVILMSPIAFQYFQQTFQTYYSSLPGVGNASNPNAPSLFTGECIPQSKIDVNKYPTISFAVTSESGDILQLPVPASSYLMLTGNCYALGVGPAIGVGLVLGDVFMENYYVVFDRTNSRLGFAPVSNCV